MAGTALDMHDLPPAERHPKIHIVFGDPDTSESLATLNGYDPRPLSHEMQAEVDAFDADNYTVE